MKVLMLSLDQKIFNEHSKSQKRILDYGTITDELHVVIFTTKKMTPVRIGANAFLYPTNSRIKPLYFFTAYRICKKIIKTAKKRGGISLISTQDAFPTGVVGYWLKRKFNLPLQIQVHIDFFSPFFWRESFFNKIYSLFARLLLPKADGVRVVSQEIKNYLINNLKINSHKIITLPVFPNINNILDYPVKINLREKYHQFQFIIFMPTRFVKQKNIPMAIFAMAEIIRNHPQVGLVFAGAGAEEKKLRLLTKKLGLMKDVIFEPWDCDLFSYYKTADLFLLTSNYEGWALTVTEAMASGLPVVATPVGCAKEIIIHGDNGWLVSLNNIAALVSAIEYLYKNPEQRELMAKEGQATIRKLKPVTKAEYLDCYQKGLKMITSN